MNSSSFSNFTSNHHLSMAAGTKLISPASTASIGNLLIAITTGNSSSSAPVENLEDVYRHLNSSIDLSILLLEGTKKHLLEGCLIISAVSLVASFFVYCLLSELRTVPGKCLMGLIISELITDILVVAALQFQPHTSTCFVIGVLIHFFFLTIISWTSVIAFDLLKKFKYPNQQLRHFVRYIFYVYLVPLAIVATALCLEFSPATSGSLLRPLYGRRICFVSAPLSKMIFVTIPINVSLLINLVVFLFAIFKIKQVVNEISHSSISSSVRERCLWYVKLSLLLGVSSLFGFFGIQLPCCQILKFTTFLINSLHGTFIFVAFTCKRSTVRMLAKHFRRKTGTSGVVGSTKSYGGGGGIENGSSRKTIKFNLDDFDENDSRESSIRAMGSLSGSNDRKRIYRNSCGTGLGTITTITSSSVTSDSASFETVNGDTPNRKCIALHSLDNAAYQ